VSVRDLAQLACDVDVRCRLRGSFTLRSGQVSKEYFDKYLFESDPALLRRVASAMAELVPAGGDPRGRTVVLIEDVITTGGAAVHAAQAFRELGATVTTVVCAIDRSHPGASGLTLEGIAVRSVLTKAMLDAAASGGPAAL
jgi:orotate phosphoribosyltransferase